jgi:hypothetical protein
MTAEGKPPDGERAARSRLWRLYRLLFHCPDPDQIARDARDVEAPDGETEA